jgi:hypothetical protein
VVLALVIVVCIGGLAGQAQTFAVGSHVEALPYGSNWYPCVVTRGAPNYGVKCTNIDGTSSDFSVMATRLRADSGQAAAAMAERWAKRFMPGSHVEAAPYGEQNGYHSCTVLSVTGSGATVGIYHLKCDMGYETGPANVDVGAIDFIRAAAQPAASMPARGGVAAGAGQVQTPVQGAGGAVAQGVYECWSSGQANFMLNFSITGAHQYSGANGGSGSFAFDAASKRIAFKGGSLEGAMPAGFYTIYYAPQGRPTVSFRNPSGNEAAFCQKR